MPITPSWWAQYIALLLNVLNLVVIGITAIILYWYTKETKRLRKNAEKQIEISQQQVRATQQQTEVMQRPFIVVDPVWREMSTTKFLRKIIVRNIGNSAALNVIMLYGLYRVSIAIIDKNESIEVEVIQEGSVSNTRRALRLASRMSGTGNQDENALEEEHILELDSSSIERGIGLKIEYHNVAMIQYHTTQFILPTGVRIEGSGRMSPLP